jgi:mutator protein MutT
VTLPYVAIVTFAGRTYKQISYDEGMPNLLVSAKAVIQKDGTILLVKKTRPGTFYWDLPGGRLEYGETSEQAAKREVMEETGIDVIVGELLGVWQYFSVVNKHQVVCITYLCDGDATAVDVTRNEAIESIEDFAWVKVEDIASGSYPTLDPSLLVLLRKLA